MKNNIIKNLKKYFLLIITMFILLLMKNKTSGKINFHSPESAIVLDGSDTKIALIPNIECWINKNIINEREKTVNIKLENNFIANTLKQQDAKTFLELLNQNYLTENNDNLVQNVINNSNAILTNNTEITNNSNSIINNNVEIKHNSNAIIKLTQGATGGGIESQINTLEIKIRNNSNAIVTTNYTTLERNITNNSNAIINLDKSINQNSNVIINSIHRINNNSNSIKFIDSLTKQNSNSIIYNYNNLKQNSNTINSTKYLVNKNEKTITTNHNNIRYNSNLIISNKKNIRYNSNTILSIDENNDIPYLQSQVDTNKANIKNNSNAIVKNKDGISSNISEIPINRSDIDNNTPKITDNTNDISSHSPRIDNNESDISNNIKEIKNNSNAIIKLTTGSTPGGIQSQIDINKIKIKQNSNVIVKISKKDSQKLLTENPITENISLQESVLINPGKAIVIDENITIDGKGSILLFGSNNSQFIVKEGKSVTLRNIQLLRINNNTFNLRYKSYKNGSIWNIDDAKIIIGKNVTFGLSENITVSQGFIEITNKENEIQTFKIKGIEGKKEFKIDPSDEYSNALSMADNGITWDERKEGTHTTELSKLEERFTLNKTVPVLLKLNNNEINLQNIKLSGVEHITHKENLINSGKLILSGETEIEIGDETFNDFQINNDIQETCNKNFIIQGLNNKIQLYKNNIKFNGRLRFSNFEENSLQISTIITTKKTNNNSNTNRNIPIINFGNDFMKLESEFGLSRLIFSDNQIRIKNDTSSSFLINGNSILQGNYIEVQNNPIKTSLSNNKELIIELDQLIGLDDISNKPIDFTN